MPGKPCWLDIWHVVSLPRRLKRQIYLQGQPGSRTMIHHIISM